MDVMKLDAQLFFEEKKIRDDGHRIARAQSLSVETKHYIQTLQSMVPEVPIQHFQTLETYVDKLYRFDSQCTLTDFMSALDQVFLSYQKVISGDKG